MSPLSLPDNVKSKLHFKLKTWYENHKESPLFSIHEKAQIERLIDYIEVVRRGHNQTELDMDKQAHDFKSFYEQYDVRRNKDFRATFTDPELLEWYDSIQVDYSIPDVEVTNGAITHYEPGEYESDVKTNLI